MRSLLIAAVSYLSLGAIAVVSPVDLFPDDIGSVSSSSIAGFGVA
jgi:hypothetical protein